MWLDCSEHGIDLDLTKYTGLTRMVKANTRFIDATTTHQPGFTNNLNVHTA